jgi:hypothetical protein
MTLPDWRQWFVETARQVIRLCPDNGVAIFFQTDVKHEGTWVDKGYLCSKAAELEGVSLLWNKVVCRAPAGVTTFGRPAYAHLLCFSRGLRTDTALSTPDVLPETGAMTWARAIGLKACGAAVRYVKEQTQTHCVVDPFCGVGTVLAMANALGLEAVGVERNRKRAERAERLRIVRGGAEGDWKVLVSPPLVAQG